MEADDGQAAHGDRRTQWLRQDHAGAGVPVVFLFLDSADTCVARVQERKRKGGHGVPESDIRRRFDHSLRNFWMIYRFLADDWAVMYNAASEFQDVAFGAGGNVSVRDEALFSQFIGLAGRSEA
jgi:predicted ABC-type ATPase